MVGVRFYAVERKGGSFGPKSWVGLWGRRDRCRVSCREGVSRDAQFRGRANETEVIQEGKQVIPSHQEGLCE